MAQVILLNCKMVEYLLSTGIDGSLQNNDAVAAGIKRSKSCSNRGSEGGDRGGVAGNLRAIVGESSLEVCGGKTAKVHIRS